MAVDINKSTKKMYVYVIFLIIGLSLIFYGILEMVVQDHAQTELTENQIIEKAKDLGMVEVKDAFSKAIEKSKE